MVVVTERGHRVDALVTAIREAIISGDLGPGQRIDQDEWAERSGLSRTPVRLALERLEAQGFIRLLPRRGASVVEVTTQYLEDILGNRLVLESALGRAGAGNLTPRDLKLMKADNRELQAVKLPESHRDITEPSARFHRRLYAAAAMPMLERNALQAVDHSHVFLNRQWYANRQIAQVTKTYYAELLVACEQTDLDRVESVMRIHRINLAGVVLRERVQMSDLEVLPKLLDSSEIKRLTALVDKGADPEGPAPRGRSAASSIKSYM